MTIYTVHARSSPQSDPMGVAFVKDGFCWPALFFAVLWMIFRRMWLVLFLYVLAGVALTLLGQVLPTSAIGTIAFFGVILFAFEANQLRAWTLGRRGYRMIGVAEGRGVLDAETRFFSSLPPAPLAITAAQTGPSASAGPRLPAEAASPVLGLFPSPGPRA